MVDYTQRAESGSSTSEEEMEDISSPTYGVSPIRDTQWQDVRMDEEQIRRLYQDEEHADVELTCEGKTWKLHQAVLCQRSGHFQKAFDEYISKDDVKMVEICNWSAWKVDQMIHYIYNFRCYEISRYDFTSRIELWELGEAFKMPGLCDDAVNTLKINLKRAANEILLLSDGEGTDPQLHSLIGERDSDQFVSSRMGNSPTRSSAAQTAIPTAPLTDDEFVMEVLAKFRAAVSASYSAQSPMVAGNPIRLHLISFYVRGGFRYLDPRFGLRGLIDEFPEFAIDVMHHLRSTVGDLWLMAKPRTCVDCRAKLGKSFDEHDDGAFPRQFKRWFLCSKIKGTDAEVIGGWNGGLEARCALCTLSSLQGLRYLVE
ncbi:Uu.00g109400.m01.CDS01 [Anthostomella pinea]|uniref:Uu.00g109400.m01.CDS01 n=1 Tax=Anthostomella pinea TaxID=933095 RepID=A0AAI8V9K1_9PEZI|nr:Uu.00g109400.m01.CDS01 [Anthostomella pinea]